MWPMSMEMAFASHISIIASGILVVRRCLKHKCQVLADADGDNIHLHLYKVKQPRDVKTCEPCQPATPGASVIGNVHNHNHGSPCGAGSRNGRCMQRRTLTTRRSRCRTPSPKALAVARRMGLHEAYACTFVCTPGRANVRNAKPA